MRRSKINPLTLELLGKTKTHLTWSKELNSYIHKDVISDFFSLKELAKKDNIEISIISGFRSFDRQLVIWNEKAKGLRDIYDRFSKLLDHQNLSQEELLFSILNYSAIPGFSRHHLGTDLDIYDLMALPNKDYQIKLQDAEYSENGVFHSLNLWLNSQIEKESSFNFYFPYRTDNGGVMPEKWHISHSLVHERYIEYLTLDLFTSIIENSEILLKSPILDNKKIIFEKFIQNI